MRERESPRRLTGATPKDSVGDESVFSITQPVDIRLHGEGFQIVQRDAVDGDCDE